MIHSTPVIQLLMVLIYAVLQAVYYNYYIVVQFLPGYVQIPADVLSLRARKPGNVACPFPHPLFQLDVVQFVPATTNME